MKILTLIIFLVVTGSTNIAGAENGETATDASVGAKTSQPQADAMTKSAPRPAETKAGPGSGKTGVGRAGERASGKMQPESDSVEDWVAISRDRARRISELKHQQQILEEHVRIAELRVRCQSYGSNCGVAPQVRIVRSQTAEPTMATPALPVVTGVSGGKVRLKSKSGREAWYRKGDVYQGYRIHAIRLDHVVFRLPQFNKDFKVPVEAPE